MGQRGALVGIANREELYRVHGDAEGLDLLDVCLYMSDPDTAQELQAILGEAGSAWTMGSDSSGASTPFQGPQTHPNPTFPRSLKWFTVIGDVETVWKMMETIWKSHDGRHGTDDTTRPRAVSQPVSRAAVQVGITPVQLFRTGAIQRKHSSPGQVIGTENPPQFLVKERCPLSTVPNSQVTGWIRDRWGGQSPTLRTTFRASAPA